MKLNDVKLTRLHQHHDGRGWLTETFRQDELDRPWWPVMSYVSCTHGGEIRGPHEHSEQSDLFVFLTGEWRVTLWDNRKRSSTFGKKSVIEINEPYSLLVPPGVVHAYQNVGVGEGLVLNFPNQLYAGAGRLGTVDEIRHEDNSESVFRV